MAPSSSQYADILLKFKDSVKISGNALSSWTKSMPPCNGKKANWAGVLCDNMGQIWGLQLEKMGLSGDINMEALKQLPDLRSISVIKNNFEGSLPDLKKLSALKTVYLSDNKFSGEIPSDWFQGMSALKKLHLANNQFTGEIPKSLTTLDKLMELTLEGNKFSGKIPDFPQARWGIFNVSNNNLEGEIPDGFGKLNASFFAGESQVFSRYHIH